MSRSDPAAPTGASASSSWRRLAGLGAGILIVQLVAVACFLLAQTRNEPHDLALGVAAPAAVAQQLEGGLDRAKPGAFDVRRYDTPAEARRAVEEREVGAAFTVEGPGELRILTASAGGPAVAQLVTEVGRHAAEPMGVKVAVDDVRPIDPDDARGTALNAMVLPLVATTAVFGGLIGATRAAGRRRVVTILVGMAAGSGALVASLLQWRGVVPSSWWEVASIAGLMVLAVAASAAGLARWLGSVGTGLASVVYILIGALGAGAAMPAELLPWLWRYFGPWLPPGLGVDAIRGQIYFDGAANGLPLSLLGTYAVAGLLLVVLRRRRVPARAAEAPAPVEVPVAAGR